MTRIDAIWVDQDTATKILKHKTKDTIKQLSTDYKMIIIKIDPSEWINRKYIAWVRNANQKPKKLWDIKKTDEEQWETYKNKIENNIRKLEIEIKNKTINNKWNAFKQIIINATNNNITKAKTPKNRTTKNCQWKKQIITDRIVTTKENGEIEILTSPIKIKKQIKEHMEKWMTNSNEETTETPPEWEKEYELKQEIQNTIFQTVTQEISIEELENILKESAKNKAPGPTGITYEM
ncbi:4896_t:CDS:2 [Dentiscutata erythropus]|uniref:4896_t:CDS:1 n=1 Tax=Dentiscutata erythropus TaxID=1348616 RepID=A0A9N9H955_9GLOM|nr:4896_t:CDS:2 [Dentiscutata erythropus]